jgi:hypothetical protein
MHTAASRVENSAQVLSCQPKFVKCKYHIQNVHKLSAFCYIEGLILDLFSYLLKVEECGFESDKMFTKGPTPSNLL